MQTGSALDQKLVDTGPSPPLEQLKALRAIFQLTTQSRYLSLIAAFHTRYIHSLPCRLISVAEPAYINPMTLAPNMENQPTYF